MMTRLLTSCAFTAFAFAIGVMSPGGGFGTTIDPVGPGGQPLDPNAKPSVCKIKCPEDLATTTGKFGTSVYVGVRVEIDWNEARDICNAGAARPDGSEVTSGLVEINSPAENDYVRQLIHSLEILESWVGLRRFADEMLWQPFAGGPPQIPVYENWAMGQPDNGMGLEGCGSMNGVTGHWSDRSCLELHAFVCELDCDDGDPCTLDEVDGDAFGCTNTPIGFGPLCSLAIDGVSPNAADAGATRDFLVTGVGMESVTAVQVPGATVVEWSALGPGILAVTVALPPSDGVYDLVLVSDTLAGDAVLESAIAASASPVCSPFDCQSTPCTSDLDCVDGDICSADRCDAGACTSSMLPKCCPEKGCKPCLVGFDVNGSGSVDIADVQCSILGSLWLLGGAAVAQPGCLGVPVVLADGDCDGTIAVSDVLLVILSVLSGDLGPDVDSDDDGCPDACQ